jgi:DNA-binding transcriptional LysR family regulator
MNAVVDLLAHLDAFSAVAERRSFSAAAEQLHIAQPLLSRRIKNLERRLGGELFERSQRHVRITELGQLLLPHAEDVIARTGHLLALAESAHRTASVAVGIPPECDPASLARLIRGAAEHGALISVQESPARDRAAALDDGRLACALVRVPVEGAALVVALGVASVAGAAPEGGLVHLDGLRPRRSDPDARPVRLLVLPEDDIALHTDRLARALAAAGMAERSMEVASSASTAVAEVLAGSGRLLCDERFARRHGLAWSPLADRVLHRGYELAVNANRPHIPSVGRLAPWLVALLATATGALPAGGREVPPRPDGEDRRRLAAGV